MLFTGSLLLTSTPLAHADFNANDIIDDSIYNNTSTMNAGQIDNWLNGNFGSASCISTAHGFSAPDPTGYSPGGGFTYSGNVSAGRVIYDAAQTYGLNPEVLLVTLQKEQSLVTGGSGCSVLGYTGAMGYGCPDSGTTHSYPGEGALAAPLYYINNSPVTGVSGTCVNSAAKAGFAQQVIHGAWLLKFGQQRSLGNTGWNVQLNNLPANGDHWDNSDDPQTCYGGPMTQGSYKRCSTDANPVFYDGYLTIDGSSVHMNSGATAALYWYTPHFHGNQNFYNLFSQWFGSPNSSCQATSNVNAAASGPNLTTYRYSGIDRLTYLQQNNTGSACVEMHVDGSNFQSWIAHMATGMKASDPAAGMLIPSDSAVDHQISLNYILYSGAGGHVEIHRMSPNLQRFPGYYDIGTNLSSVSPQTGTFVAGNFFGNGGYEQLAYILYGGAGGKMEVHMFSPNMTQAVGYYDLISDFGNVTKDTGVFLTGDFFGRGYDQLAYITYGDSSVHILDIRTGRVIRMYEQNTNLHNTDPSTGTFMAGDFLHRGYDQLIYVIYNNHDGCCGTAGGNVETHMFNPGLNNAVGFQDLVTNLAGFNPTD